VYLSTPLQNMYTQQLHGHLRAPLLLTEKVVSGTHWSAKGEEETDERAKDMEHRTAARILPKGD
jgi:hypothetical protein